MTFFGWMPEQAAFATILVHRWLPGSRNMKKSVHLSLQGVALASGIFGVWTKFHGKREIVGNFYSLHSWMGLFCIVLFGAQLFGWGLVHPYGWTTLRFVADNPGVWAFHCHIEAHFYLGMGVVFEEGLEKVGELPKSVMGCGGTKGNLWVSPGSTVIAKTFFCNLHRCSNKHNCPFDYHAAAHVAIAKANPVVKPRKLDKI